ncbi:MAG: hypothetical protein L0215_14280, partial [Gemmataceae bacterium]|nr:hypothetical protein [Gemmataceae bacterium]
QAARYLAQLAVNIVDYIDNDDYMTLFLWNGTWAGAGGTPEYLFGTELPRLVINEVYAQMDNDPLDPGVANNAATYYKLNVWAELFNPFKPTPQLPTPEVYPLDQGNAKLVNLDTSDMTNMTVTNMPYQLVLIKQDTSLRRPDNSKGEPQLANILTTDGMTQCVVDDWNDPMNPATRQVLPGDGKFSGPPMGNDGFYVIGPIPNNDADPANHFLAGRNPGFATTQKSKKLSAKILPTEKDGKFSVLLRRLANPHLAFDPLGNPYITVDYIDKIYIDAGVLNGIKIDPAGADLSKTMDMGQSLGRKQPYAADMGGTQADPYDATKSQWLPQDPIYAVPPMPAPPKHTLFRHNAREETPPPNQATPNQTLKMPFDWLVHLDRAPINPIDLLHVSGYRPFELTQQFVQSRPAMIGQQDVAFLHYAPWVVEPTLLYRFLELTAVQDQMDGQATPGNGRVPGKIAINSSMFEKEILEALCDPQAVSGFTLADIATLHAKIMQSRNGPDGMPYTQDDKPFMPLGVGFVSPPDPNGQFPNGLGINDTILRDDPTVPVAPKPKLFELQNPNVTHPYKRAELLQKVYNNVTTRSNCFAVWLTVGFFEVVDETARPPKLGKEIGKSENRNIRHRMFAIIDRTHLQIRPLWFNTTDKDTGWRVVNYEPTTGEVTGQSLDPRPDLNFQTRNGAPFQIQVGTQLQVFPDTPFEETVTVTTPPVGNQFKFNLRNPLPMGFIPVGQTIISRGNPGPWQRYAVRQDPLVVPHFSIIE